MQKPLAHCQKKNQIIQLAYILKLEGQYKL